MTWTTQIMLGGFTVHHKDMVELPIKHPEVAREFAVGNFTYTEDKKFDVINPNWLGT